MTQTTPTPLDASLGAQLKALRERQGLSQRELERRTKGRIRSSHISQIESGKVAEPSLAVLREIASAFDLDLASFLKTLDVIADASDSMVTPEEWQHLASFRELDEQGKKEAADFVRWRLQQALKMRDPAEPFGELPGRSELIAAQVGDIRRRLAPDSFPVDVDEAVRRAGLSAPYPLFDSGFEDYLLYLQSNGSAFFSHAYEVVGGFIDPHSNEIFVNERLSPARRRFVLAHELMHHELGHTGLLRLNVRLSDERREEMETEASLAAAEFICPASELWRLFITSSQSSCPVLLADFRTAARKFGITTRTVMRQFLETPFDRPAALLSLRLPRNYEGIGEPNHIHMTVQTNDAWKVGKLSWMKSHDVLYINSDPLALAVHQVLSRSREAHTLERLTKALARKYGVRAEAYLTGRFVHAFVQIDERGRTKFS